MAAETRHFISIISSFTFFVLFYSFEKANNKQNLNKNLNKPKKTKKYHKKQKKKKKIETRFKFKQNFFHG